MLSWLVDEVHKISKRTAKRHSSKSFLACSTQVSTLEHLHTARWSVDERRQADSVAFGDLYNFLSRSLGLRVAGFVGRFFVRVRPGQAA